MKIYNLVYENDLNQLFDSYFWISGTKGEQKMWREFRDSAGVHQTRMVRNPVDIREIVSFSTTIVDSYNPYSQIDADKILITEKAGLKSFIIKFGKEIIIALVLAIIVGIVIE